MEIPSMSASNQIKYSICFNYKMSVQGDYYDRSVVSANCKFSTVFFKSTARLLLCVSPLFVAANPTLQYATPMPSLPHSLAHSTPLI